MNLDECTDCVFADKPNNIQLGCTLDALGDYIYELNNAGFFKFNDHRCQFKRDDAWASQTLANKVEQEVQINYEYAFLCPKDYHPKINFDWALKQKISPSKTIAIMFDYKQYIDMQPWIKNAPKEHTIMLCAPDFNYRKELLTQCKSKFLLFRETTITPYHNLMDWLNTQINKHGFRFNIIGDLDAFIISPDYFFKFANTLEDIIEISKKLKGYCTYDFVRKNAERGNSWSSQRSSFKGAPVTAK